MRGETPVCLSEGELLQFIDTLCALSMSCTVICYKSESIFVINSCVVFANLLQSVYLRVASKLSLYRARTVITVELHIGSLGLFVLF